MRLSLIALISLVSFQLNAQNVAYIDSLGLDAGAFSNVQTTIIKDLKNQRTGVFLNDPNLLKGIIFNDKMAPLHNFEFPFVDEEVLGGYIKGDLVSIFSKKKRGKEMTNVVYNLASKASDVYHLPFKLDDEKFIGKTNNSDAFLYITASKKEPVITIYKLTENKIDILSYDLSEFSAGALKDKNDLWQKLTRQDGLSRTVDVAMVQAEMECDIETAKSPNKLYLRGDSLLLIMDTNRAETMIFSMALNNKKLSYRNVKHNIPNLSKEIIDIPTYNSFLLEDRLYYVYASLSDLTLISSDYTSGKEIQRYYAESAQEISFKNTPIVQEGSSYFSQKRKLEKTSQLLRKMVRGQSVVAAAEGSENKHEITIGAYKEIKRSGSTMMPGVGGAPAMMMVGPSYSWDRLTRFKMIVSPETAKHIPGDLKASPNEQLSSYIEENGIKEKNTGVFSIDDKYYLTVFDDESTQITILEFDRNSSEKTE